MAKQDTLIRWAGGKSWFIPYFQLFTKNLQFNAYYEPFAGGASIFFSCINNHKAFLSDLNEELISAYEVVKHKPKMLIRCMKKMNVSQDDYYYYRDEYVCKNDVEKAARFLYLNHSSFNGIYRVNSRGEYNVPYGKRDVPYNTEVILTANQKLKNASLQKGDFGIWEENIKSKDLVFLDPPYSVSSKRAENGFIGYNAKLFSLEDQRRLKSFIDKIVERNAYYILTNAAHPKVEEIFQECGVRIDLSRSCVIGGRNAQRGRVKEYIFTNIPKEYWGEEDGYIESVN